MIRKHTVFLISILFLFASTPLLAGPIAILKLQKGKATIVRNQKKISLKGKGRSKILYKKDLILIVGKASLRFMASGKKKSLESGVYYKIGRRSATIVKGKMKETPSITKRPSHRSASVVMGVKKMERPKKKDPQPPKQVETPQPSVKVPGTPKEVKKVPEERPYMIR